MATPNPYAPALLDYAGTTIARLVRENLKEDAIILDVGAGWGKYRFLLPEYEMDAVELWVPYIEANKLRAYYHNVYVEDIVTFNFPHRYNAIVMGDVLEHIEVADAQSVVKKLCLNADFVYIATPFEMEQEAVEGNEHEEHKMADLTLAIMEERFPELQLLESFGRPGEHEKAIYTNRYKK